MKSLIVLMFFVATVGQAKPLTGEVHVNIKGMVCGFCAQGLTKTFEKQSAVEKVHVSLEDKSMHLTLKKDQSFDSDVILKLIEEAGYKGTISEK